MPEDGLPLSNQSSIITTPITSRPSNTSRSNVEHENLELEGKREFPKPANINEYYEFKNEPYSLEYFNLAPELRKIDTYKNYAQYLDDFVIGEIEDKSLDNNLDSYSNILTEIMDSIQMNPDTTSLVKLEKLYGWIKRVLIPNRDIERKRKEIIGE